MVQENTTTNNKDNKDIKVYKSAPLIGTLLQGTIIAESIYLITDYWSSYLKAVGNFATTNLNIFNTSVLPQLTSLYNSIVNNPITTAVVTVGVGLGFLVSNLIRNTNYGDVENTNYSFGEKNIEKVFNFSKIATIPTTIVAGIYSTISGTANSWSFFDSNILKNVPQVLGNYSALFTTVGIGLIVYSSESFVRNITNIGRGVYEKSLMVKELFKDTKKAFKGKKIEPLKVKVEEDKKNPTKSEKNKSEQVKFFERLVKVGERFSVKNNSIKNKK